MLAFERWRRSHLSGTVTTIVSICSYHLGFPIPLFVYWSVIPFTAQNLRIHGELFVQLHWPSPSKFNGRFTWKSAIWMREISAFWSNYSNLTRPGPPKGSQWNDIPLFQGNPGEIWYFGQIIFRFQPLIFGDVNSPSTRKKNTGLWHCAVLLGVAFGGSWAFWWVNPWWYEFSATKNNPRHRDIIGGSFWNSFYFLPIWTSRQIVGGFCCFF